MSPFGSCCVDAQIACTGDAMGWPQDFPTARVLLSGFFTSRQAAQEEPKLRILEATLAAFALQ